MRGPAMDARWRPWMNALRRHAPQKEAPREKEIARAHETSVVWMEWNWTTESDIDDESWRLAFEAFELLAILAHSDQAAWRQLMEHWWPEARAYWAYAQSSRVFELGCEVGITTTGVLGLCGDRLVREDIDAVVSEEYEELRRELEDSLQDAIDPPPKIIAHVRILVEESAPAEIDELHPLLFEVVQLVSFQFGQEQAPLVYQRKWTQLFRIEQVSVYAFFSFHTPRDLEYMHRIASFGVQVPNLQLNNMEITPKTAPQYTTMLQRMFAVAGSDAPRECSPSDSFWLHNNATSQSYDGIFSALLHSKTVRDYVHIIPDENPLAPRPPRTPARVRYWQWIAAAIFSPLATNPIDDVSLHGLDMEMEDAIAFEQTLHAPNPLSVLFPGSAPNTTLSSVAASRFRLSEDVSDTDTSSLLTLASPVECLQIPDTVEHDEWLSVLLPGWGRAWVKRSDATINQPPVPVTPTSVRPILRLHMDHPDMDVEAMMKVLQAGGSVVKHLELTNWMDDSTSAPNSWLDRVLRACPQLDGLEISCIPIQSLDVFTRAYESGVCRMRRLTIESARIDDIQTSAIKFINALATPGHPMAEHLRELVICPTQGTEFPRGLLSVIASMLKANHVLSDLTLKPGILSADLQLTDPADVALLEQIANHSGESVAIRVGPLALQSKLAFLSVVLDHNQASPSVHPLQSIDTNAISLVFQYAAACRKRKVSVGARNEVRSIAWGP